MDEGKSKDDANNIDGMISFCERYLEKVKNKNIAIANDLSDKLKVVYDPASRGELENKIDQEWRETKIQPEGVKYWSINNIQDQSSAIYYDIASAYLKDGQENLGYYFSDPKNVLVDSWYGTKNEEDYLLYVANKHQEK